ncbi:MAG TPA: hypothetical protein VM163_09395 [bacterium]|nr:hypothetical protein [bacterium]
MPAHPVGNREGVCPEAPDSERVMDMKWDSPAVIAKAKSPRAHAAESRLETLFAEMSPTGLCIPNFPKVKSYLFHHPDMIDLVQPICKAVLDRFPKPSQVALELYQDPEIEDQYLTVYVRQEQYDEDILDELHEVSNHFDDILCDTSGWLLITTDFQDPLAEKQCLEKVTNLVG